MFLYMLSFAGVSNVSLMRGHVIDAPDFPHIGHAWVRVWHLYYDPTFDDPIGLSKPRTYNTYRYFWLPKDLFYTNRFNYWSLPQHLKNGSLETRKDYINKELSKLATKYKNSKYLLLKPFVFKSSNNIALNLHINIETLKQILPYKEVYDYEFLEDGEQKTISNIDYYTVNDENIEILLEQLNYNLSGYYLFKWDNESYRLAYNVVF
jgi:hypothetical protein